MSAQETRDAELVARAALSFHETVLAQRGEFQDFDATKQLAYELRERGLMPWSAPSNSDLKLAEIAKVAEDARFRLGWYSSKSAERILDMVEEFADRILAIIGEK